MLRFALRLSPALAATALLAACATTAPSVTRWNGPPVGATWEVAQRNTGSFGRDAQFRMTREDGSWQGKPVAVLRNSLGPRIMVDPETGHWLAVVMPDGKPALSFDPPIGWKYPVQLGASSTSRHRVTNHAMGATSEIDYACKVEAYEKVTVRAGTFDTYRIVCTNSGGTEETYWSSPANGLFIKTRLVRSERYPQGPGVQEAELVVAPAVR